MDPEKIKAARIQAIKELGELIDAEKWGGLTTGMCARLGISMDQFLIFAHMPEHNQKNIIIALWGKLSTEVFGH